MLEGQNLISQFQTCHSDLSSFVVLLSPPNPEGNLTLTFGPRHQGWPQPGVTARSWGQETLKPLCQSILQMNLQKIETEKRETVTRGLTGQKDLTGLWICTRASGSTMPGT